MGKKIKSKSKSKNKISSKKKIDNKKKIIAATGATAAILSLIGIYKYNEKRKEVALHKEKGKDKMTYNVSSEDEIKPKSKRHSKPMSKMINEELANYMNQLNI